MSSCDTPWQVLRDLAVEAARKDRVRPMTPNHARYIQAVESSTVTVCVGPAGTGKTYMACGLAAQMLQEGRIDRIVITRPLTPCGNGYGFRPGTTLEKVMPDMRPMVEALEEFLGKKSVEKYIRDEVIELWPLDDMRGANIPRAFIICDEAQNCLGKFQLHMLLTRFAKESRLVICGDDSTSQTDVRHHGINPLREVIRRFSRDCHQDISLVHLGREDIVRHPLIQWIDERMTIPLEELEAQWASGSAAAAAGGWNDLKCPECKATLWYKDPEDALDQVECYQCMLPIDLWTDDEYDPHAAETRRGDAAETFPEKR